MTGLVPIEAIRLRPQPEPYRGQTASIAVRMQILPIGDLRIDRTYQRRLSDKSISVIRKITKDFQWSRFGAITVARLDDGFAVIDGQHRAIAAACIGITDLPCLVTTGETQDQARTFVAVNAARTNVNSVDKFRAACAAGDQAALSLKTILDDLEITVTSMPMKDGRRRETRAITTLQNLLARRGSGQTFTLLELLTDAGDDPEYLTAFAIRATDLHLAAVLAVEGDLDHLLAQMKATQMDALRSDASRAGKMLGGAPAKHGAAMLARTWNRLHPDRMIKL